MESENITRSEETGTDSDHFVEKYRWGEEIEDAWISYQLALSKPERDALHADRPTYDALSRLFFAAGSHEELEQYANMTVSELARLAADKDAAVLAGLDAAAFEKLVAELNASEPARLVAALARLAAAKSQETQQETQPGTQQET